MNLDEFIDDLHFNVDKVRPVDFEVDWDDAPLAYKLYRNLPMIPLSTDIPLQFAAAQTLQNVCLEQVSQLFWYTFGLTQMCQSFHPPENGDAMDHNSNIRTMQTLRRFVPSGGGLYPSELYVYLKVDGLSAGLYHYDVAHHRLVLLREGNFDDYVSGALGHRFSVSACFGVVFVSTMFWKNFYKYNDFSYRLQGLDAGVVITQLTEVAKRLGYSSAVYFQFLDDALNHLMGLREDEETIYVAVPLSVDTGAVGPPHHETTGEMHKAAAPQADHIQSARLRGELQELQHTHFVKSKNITPYLHLMEMNRAARLESTDAFLPLFSPLSERGNQERGNQERGNQERGNQERGNQERGNQERGNQERGNQERGNQERGNRPTEFGFTTTELPAVLPLDYDFASACRKRYSPGVEFVLGRGSLQKLVTLLKESTTEPLFHRTDVDAVANTASHLSLGVCLHGIEGIADGAYVYVPGSHVLRRVRSGDHRIPLQQGMSMHNVNLFDVPVCLHVLGDRNHLKTALGYRGYRIQQMEVGMLVQRVLLIATALGWGGHPLLGYDEATCDELYNTAAQGKTCLIQIPIGPYQTYSRLQGPMYG